MSRREPSPRLQEAMGLLRMAESRIRQLESELNECSRARNDDSQTIAAANYRIHELESYVLELQYFAMGHAQPPRTGDRDGAFGV